MSMRERTFSPKKLPLYHFITHEILSPTKNKILRKNNSFFSLLKSASIILNNDNFLYNSIGYLTKDNILILEKDDSCHNCVFHYSDIVNRYIVTNNITCVLNITIDEIKRCLTKYFYADYFDLDKLSISQLQKVYTVYNYKLDIITLFSLC
jgi:hypothetical protein